MKRCFVFQLPKPELKLAIEYDIVDGELFEDELTANMISDSSDSESSDDESDGDQPFASHLNASVNVNKLY